MIVNTGTMTTTAGGTLDMGTANILSGTGTFTIRVTGNDAPFTTADFALTITSPYATWQGSKFTVDDIATGLTTPTADFDHDGLPNLVEYAFGTNPKATNTSPVTVNVVGNKLQVTFPCNASCTDITYTVQASSNLTAWTDIAKSTGGAKTDSEPLGSPTPLSTVSDTGTGLRTVTRSSMNSTSPTKPHSSGSNRGKPHSDEFQAVGDEGKRFTADHIDGCDQKWVR